MTPDDIAPEFRSSPKDYTKPPAIDGVRVLRVSPFYETAPVGGVPQPDYVNAVALVATSLAPHALLARMHAIERRQHRRREGNTVRNAPRTLDLDLLLYGARRIHSARLTVPHPRMHERAFVLRPLIDVAPAITIPGRGLARRRLPEVRMQRVRRTRNPPTAGYFAPPAVRPRTMSR